MLSGLLSCKTTSLESSKTTTSEEDTSRSAPLNERTLKTFDPSFDALPSLVTRRVSTSDHSDNPEFSLLSGLRAKDPGEPSFLFAEDQPWRFQVDTGEATEFLLTDSLFDLIKLNTRVTQIFQRFVDRDLSKDLSGVPEALTEQDMIFTYSQFDFAGLYPRPDYNESVAEMKEEFLQGEQIQFRKALSLNLDSIDKGRNTFRLLLTSESSKPSNAPLIGRIKASAEVAAITSLGRVLDNTLKLFDPIQNSDNSDNSDSRLFRASQDRFKEKILQDIQCNASLYVYIDLLKTVFTDNNDKGVLESLQEFGESFRYKNSLDKLAKAKLSDTLAKENEEKLADTVGLISYFLSDSDNSLKPAVITGSFQSFRPEDSEDSEDSEGGIDCSLDVLGQWFLNIVFYEAQQVQKIQISEQGDPLEEVGSNIDKWHALIDSSFDEVFFALTSRLLNDTLQFLLEPYLSSAKDDSMFSAPFLIPFKLQRSNQPPLKVRVQVLEKKDDQIFQNEVILVWQAKTESFVLGKDSLVGDVELFYGVEGKSPSIFNDENKKDAESLLASQELRTRLNRLVNFQDFFQDREESDTLNGESTYTINITIEHLMGFPLNPEDFFSLGYSLSSGQDFYQEETD